MKINSILCALVFLAFFACSENDPVVDQENNQEPLIELEFRVSPIDLQGVEANYAEDIPYDVFDKTKFDVFIPSSTEPTGLVIFIHGGGFTGGGKGFVYNNQELSDAVLELLSNRIAVATINYRLLVDGDTDGVLKCLNDSRRAVQYMRYIHNELNIDKNNIVLYGSSAGAATSLWLATNDDFKDPNNTDFVLQESSRVKGIALNATQSSLDIETRWLGDVFDEFGSTIDDVIELYGEARIYHFYGISTLEAYNTPEILTYRHQVDMLTMLSADDPEIWVNNTGGHNNEPLTTGSFNHHPFHAKTIKEFAEAVGVPVVATYGNPILFTTPGNESYIEFLMRKLNEE
ncbi:MAG: alpha/beta hydrolase fold domain-containing protein [Bacteroidota bacterium]